MAQPYPTKPVRVVVAFAVGGFADGVARLVGLRLSERLGQPVVVDNRGGAGGNIATRIVAAAPSDGYTLLVNTAAISINATHVPFQGGGPATAAALANQVEVLSLSMPPVVPHIKSGRLKGLAISSLTRVAALPDVPTVTEAGFPGFEERSWVGYFAPAKTPAAIVKKLNGEINPILGLADVKARLDAMGLETKPGSPEAFAAYLRTEVAKWAKIVKTTGITAD